ncbi:unnamed protein product [marine sediment metagenome]|uniref:Uncharacterized protein n=1 Tax=marine sediment metagenome TaxID=412755 RepID=X0VSG8_9ZZZZ
MCKSNIPRLESVVFLADFAPVTTPKVKADVEGVKANLECLPDVLLSLVQ